MMLWYCATKIRYEDYNMSPGVDQLVSLFLLSTPYGKVTQSRFIIREDQAGPRLLWHTRRTRKQVQTVSGTKRAVNRQLEHGLNVSGHRYRPVLHHQEACLFPFPLSSLSFSLFFSFLSFLYTSLDLKKSGLVYTFPLLLFFSILFLLFPVLSFF